MHIKTYLHDEAPNAVYVGELKDIGKVMVVQFVVQPDCLNLRHWL